VVAGHGQQQGGGDDDETVTHADARRKTRARPVVSYAA
jgi:hypothetical protein